MVPSWALQRIYQILCSFPETNRLRLDLGNSNTRDVRLYFKAHSLVLNLHFKTLSKKYNLIHCKQTEAFAAEADASEHCTHRRRIELEYNTKVVPSVSGTESLPR